MRAWVRHSARATRMRPRCGVSRTTSRAGIPSRSVAPVVSIDPYEETWRRVHGGRINLTIPELIPELKSLRDEYPASDPDFPFVLSAGQRRSSTANTIIRDPQWRPKDPSA